MPSLRKPRSIFEYSPHEKQALFHKSPARIRLFLGGNRAGKTMAGAAEVVLCAVGAHPVRSAIGPHGEASRMPKTGGNIWVVGLDSKVLRSVEEPMIHSLLPKEWIASYDKLQQITTLKNGYTITCKSVDSGREKFQGAEVNLIWEDEEITGDIHRELLARTVSCRGDILITATPLMGFSWLYDEVFRPWEQGRVTLDKNGLPSLDVVQVSSFENPANDEDELARFAIGLSEEEKRSRLYGEFAQMSGLVFPEFNPAIHVVPHAHLFDACGLPELNWKSHIGMDHGAGQGATSAHLGYMCPDGIVRIAGEYYEDGGVPVLSHACALRVMCGQKPDDSRPMPTVSLDRTARQVLIELASYGIPVVKSLSDHAAGFSRIREAFAVDVTGRPGILISDRCQQLIQQLQRYSWKPPTENNDAPDRVRKRFDHAVDSFRYLLMGLPKRHVVVAVQSGPSLLDRIKENYARLIRNTKRGRMKLSYGPDGL